MLIEGLSTVLAFLVFIAPGALWTWLAERRRETPERDDVMTVAIITLTSVIFSLPASIVPTVIAFQARLGEPRLIDAFFTGGIGSPGEAARLSMLLALQLAIAGALVFLAFKILGSRIYGDLHVIRKNHWLYQFETLHDAGVPSVLAEVRIDDGVMIRGLVALASEQSKQDERELTLRHPILIEGEDGVSLLDGRKPDTVTIPGGTIKFVALYPVS